VHGFLVLGVVMIGLVSVVAVDSRVRPRASRAPVRSWLLLGDFSFWCYGGVGPSARRQRQALTPRSRRSRSRVAAGGFRTLVAADIEPLSADNSAATLGQTSGWGRSTTGICILLSRGSIRRHSKPRIRGTAISPCNPRRRSSKSNSACGRNAKPCYFAMAGNRGDAPAPAGA
jgi:hypothetical protein